MPRQLVWQALGMLGAMTANRTFLYLVSVSVLSVATVGKAVLPVERIAGPVLLISAGDDRIWPSCLMAQQLMQRLNAHRHAYADESLCYTGAGHLVLPPYRPTNANATAFLGGSILFGGKPTACAYADRNAWNKVLAFLHTALH